MAKRNKKNKKCIQQKIDMSHREDVVVGIAEYQFDNEELLKLVKELQNQINLMEQLQKEYYSSNALIERTSKRRFVDILRAKIFNIKKDRKHIKTS